MKEKFLPIGTVVLLKEATKRIMITGYCSSVPEDIDKLYDYVGCLFPEGNLAGDQVALFDHDQIGSIVYNGLDDEEFKKFNIEVKKLAAGEVNYLYEGSQNAEAVNNDLNKPLIDFENMPPLTPDNIGNIINAIKVSSTANTVVEPTAFDVESMQVPIFAVPTLDSGDPRAALMGKDENISNEFSVEDHTQEQSTVIVNDGTPVLQLQLIGGENNTTAGTNDTSDSSTATQPVFKL